MNHVKQFVILFWKPVYEYRYFPLVVIIIIMNNFNNFSSFFFIIVQGLKYA